MKGIDQTLTAFAAKLRDVFQPPRFSDIFSFRSPAKPTSRPSRAVTAHDLVEMDEGSSEDLDSTIGEYISVEQAAWMKIRFDNMLRLWVACASYLICVGLKYGGVISQLSPITETFFAYGAACFLSTWLGRGAKKPLHVDYILCTADIFAITFAVYFTGGEKSPLYFIYFIPIVIEAFHRNWEILIFQGFGSVVAYGVVLGMTTPEWHSSQLTDVGARLFFMLLAVSMTTVAVNLMRKKDVIDETRLSRMQLLTHVSQSLNRIGRQEDLPEMLEGLVCRLNDELGRQIEGWCRLFLVESGHNGLMKAISDPESRRPDLKQELSTGSCPAINTNRPFLLSDAEKEPSCPIESFSFGSHLCIPVAGAENESFGIIFCGSARKNAFRQEELQFLRFIAKSLGLGIQRFQRMEDLRKVLEMDTCAMAAFLGSAKSTEALVQALLDGFFTLISPDHLSVHLWDAAGGILRSVGTKSPFAFPEMRMDFRRGEGIPGKVLESGEATLTTDVKDDARYAGRSSNVKSLLCLPLVNLKGEPLGVVTALRIAESKAFSSKDTALASTFATRAALAIQNLVLHHAYQDELARLNAGNGHSRAA